MICLLILAPVLFEVIAQRKQLQWKHTCIKAENTLCSPFIYSHIITNMTLCGTQIGCPQLFHQVRIAGLSYSWISLDMQQGTIIIFYGDLKKKSFLLENMQYWINFKESNQNNKIEGCCRELRRQPFNFFRHELRRQHSTFCCHIPSGDKKKIWVVAMSHGNNPQLCCFDHFLNHDP